MPSRKHPLEPGGPPRIELAWGAFWKNFTVSLDGREVGRVADAAALKAGQTFPLGDGTAITVRLDQGFGGAGLLVERDGAPLPGSAGDPAEKLKIAYGLLYFLAAANAVLGLVTELAGLDFLRSIGIGWGSLCVGLVYFPLAWAVQKRRSAVALGVGMALFAIDGLLSFGLAIGDGHTPPVGGLFVRVFFLIRMLGGFDAIKALAKDTKRAA